MDVQAALTRAAELADTARRELSEISYDPIAWQAISQAGKISPIVDAGIQLRAAAERCRQIAAAIARQDAELAELVAPAEPAAEMRSIDRVAAEIAAAKVQP
jgi:hypothetical protein